MKKFLISTILAGTLSLGGCATTATVPPVAGGDPTVTAIQNFAVGACGFLPTFQTVQNIVVAEAFPAAIPLAQLANQIGTAICNAVTARAVRLGSTVPTVAGVPVLGQFVSKSVRKRASYNGVQIHGQWVNPR